MRGALVQSWCRRDPTCCRQLSRAAQLLQPAPQSPRSASRAASTLEAGHCAAETQAPSQREKKTTQKSNAAMVTFNDLWHSTHEERKIKEMIVKAAKGIG